MSRGWSQVSQVTVYRGEIHYDKSILRGGKGGLLSKNCEG